MTAKDYATIQRMLGQIEGAAVAVENDNSCAQIFDAIEIIDSILGKEEPNENQT